jgi:2-desacetyl-2-hydroxyethyl bacteriochlorophyllide A dehydrogenase
MESLNVVFTGKDQVELRTEPVGKPKAGQILIKTSRTLISTGTECICLQRKFEPGTGWDNWVKYPFYPGYSNAGVVLEVGPDVTEFKPGDRVASRSNHRQHVLSAASRAIRIPDGVTDEEATWFGLAKIAQNGVRRAEHKLGDAVVIIGMGLLGQLVTQYVRLLGAREVIAIDLSQPRLEMARAHGATHILQMGAAEALESVKQITEGRLADVVYDVTGFAAVFAPALKLVRRFGTLLLLGDTGSPSEQRLIQDVVTRGLRIVGAHDSNPPAAASDYEYWSADNIAKLFLTYVARGDMRVADLITHRYAAKSAPEAYRMLTTDRSAALGVVLDWSNL